MRLITLTLIFFLGINFLRLYSQELKMPKVKTNEFTIITPESVIKFDVLVKRYPKVHVRNGCMYHWYHANTILQTDGSFDGKLLHGKYVVYYLNNNLKIKGKFDYGLKNGGWKSWYDNGNLNEITSWKKGTKKGCYSLYNTNGELTETGRYKKNLLQGFVKNYVDGKVISEQKYKNGIVVLPKAKEKNKEMSIDNKNSEGVKPTKKSFNERISKIMDNMKNKKDNSKEPKKTSPQPNSLIRIR